MAQPRAAHPAFKAFGVAAGALAVDQQTQPFRMGEIGSTITVFRIGNLFIGSPPDQKDWKSNRLQIASQQHIKGWADGTESPGGSDWIRWAD